VDGLNALLDREGGMPLGLQWLLCQDRVRQSRLGADGHPARGDFLPPVELPRRMWAAGEIQFRGSAAPGATVRRISTVADVKTKTGRSGALVFVRVDHDFSADGAPWLAERHTIVYREPADGARAASAAETMDASAYPWRQRVTTDTVQLFRYSALTFNGHRIHYDQRYVTEVEGYPGLVVHGPLMATWLMNFAGQRLAGESLEHFTFRVQRPVYAGETIILLGRREADRLELAVANERGECVIDARASTTNP
jgi:3-methylfumaryl-CoA hydratase